MGLKQLAQREGHYNLLQALTLLNSHTVRFRGCQMTAHMSAFPLTVTCPAPALWAAC
jgi:hypothetical protein